MDIFKNIEGVMQEWSEFVTEKLKEEAIRAKYVASEDLINSFAYDIQRGSSGELAQIIIGFEPQGRWGDMKSSGDGWINVDALAEWIRNKGTAFKVKPRYRKIEKTKGTDYMIQRIAWAIAHSRFLKQGKKRRRYRFNKIFWSTISTLRVNVARNIDYRELLELEQFNKQIKVNL